MFAQIFCFHLASFAKIGSRQTGVTPATGRGGVSFPEISYWRWHSPVVYWRLAGAVVTVTVRHPANQPTNPPASHSHPALPQQQVSPTQSVVLCSSKSGSANCAAAVYAATSLTGQLARQNSAEYWRRLPSPLLKAGTACQLPVPALQP